MPDPALRSPEALESWLLEHPSKERARALGELVDKHPEDAPPFACYRLADLIVQKGYGAYYSYGNYDEARRLARVAYDMAVESAGKDEVYVQAKSAKLLAMSSYALGDYEASRAANSAAYSLYKAYARQNPDEGAEEIAKCRLGQVMDSIAIGAYDLAERILHELRPDLDARAKAARMRARIALARGDSRAALKALDDASAETSAHGRQENQYLRLLALRAARRPDDVIALCDDLVKNHAPPDFYLARIEQARGWAHSAKGDARKAIKAYERAAGHLEAVIVRDPERYAVFLGDHRDVYDELVERHLEAGRPLDALRASHRGRARYLRLSMGSAIRAQANLPAELKMREAKVRGKLCSRHHQEKATSEEARALEAEYRQIMDEVYDHHSVVADLLAPTLEEPDIQSHLAADDRIVHLHLLGDRLVYWLIGPMKIEQGETHLPRSAADIRDACRGLMATGNSAMLAWYAAEVLEPLFRPILAALPGGGRLTIVAPGALWDVPWQIVRTPKGPLLGACSAVSWLPTLSLAAPITRKAGEAGTVAKRRRAKEAPPAPTTFVVAKTLVVANPTRDLAHTVSEAEAIAKRMPATVLSGDEATPERVLEELDRHDVIHFAGHGTWDERLPYLSGLDLATGRLALFDVLARDLSHVMLAGLMGCETGRIRATGEEVRGLAVAVLASGCAGALCATTPIRDAAIVRFSELFYDAFRESRDAARALQSATREATATHSVPLDLLASIRYVGREVREHVAGASNNRG